MTEARHTTGTARSSVCLFGPGSWDVDKGSYPSQSLMTLTLRTQEVFLLIVWFFWFFYSLFVLGFISFSFFSYEFVLCRENPTCKHGRKDFPNQKITDFS